MIVDADIRSDLLTAIEAACSNAIDNFMGVEQIDAALLATQAYEAAEDGEWDTAINHAKDARRLEGGDEEASVYRHVITAIQHAKDRLS